MIVPSFLNCGGAFGGDRLEGDSIVRLVFMDEAGIGNPEQEPWLVVSGVIVDADKKLVAIERHIEKLVKRYIPEEQQAGFVFHAHELINGGGKVFDRKKWPIEKRLEIADALCATAKKFDLPLAFGFVERSKFTDKTPKLSAADRTLAAHGVAFMSTAMQVEMWMRQHTSGEVCLLVVENNDTARRLITDVHTAHQNPEKLKKLWGGRIPEAEANYFPFRRIKQHPLFEPKSPSSLLQLADFYAYVFKKFLLTNVHYKRFYDVVWPQLVHGSIKLPHLDDPSPKGGSDERG